MRKQFLNFGLMALILLSACTKEEATDVDNNEGGTSGPVVEQPEFVSFSATMNPLLSGNGESSNTDDKFVEGDRISVYAWAGEYSEENFIVKNSIYTCTPEGFFDPIAGTDTINWKDEATPHYFVATYPEHTIAADLKSFSFDYYDSNLLVAKGFGENGAGFSSVNDTVNLAFSRVMARVNVEFNLTEDFADATVKIMKFKNIADKGSLDIITNQITASGEADLGFASVAGNWGADVIPQEIKPNSLVATIKIDSQSELNCTYNESLTFQSGYIYTLTFTPKGDETLQLESVTMTPWIDGGNLGDGALFPIASVAEN